MQSAEFENQRFFGAVGGFGSLTANVYHNPTAKAEEGRAKHLVEELFHYYMDNLSMLPNDYRKNLEEDGPERVVADYIAGMTDNFAIQEFSRLFIPKSWS